MHRVVLIGRPCDGGLHMSGPLTLVVERRVELPARPEGLLLGEVRLFEGTPARLGPVGRLRTARGLRVAGGIGTVACGLVPGCLEELSAEALLFHQGSIELGLGRMEECAHLRRGLSVIGHDLIGLQNPVRPREVQCPNAGVVPVLCHELRHRFLKVHRCLSIPSALPGFSLRMELFVVEGACMILMCRNFSCRADSLIRNFSRINTIQSPSNKQRSSPYTKTLLMAAVCYISYLCFRCQKEISLK